MTFRLLGLPEELRLAIEQAGGEPTEEARVIVEAAVNEATTQVQQTVTESLRELQSIIGPHGTISRLQAGGVRISTGEGIGIYADGVYKTQIAPRGDVIIGSDITQPETTTEIFFVEDADYNGEQFSAGDFLIGDNSTGSSNVKFDASEGQLQFRSGQTAKAYMDTDGSLKAGTGVVTLDENGIIIEVTNSSQDERSYKFKFENGTIIGGLYGVEPTTGNPRIVFETGGSGFANSETIVQSEGATQADTIIKASKTGASTVELRVNSSGTPQIVLNYGGVDADTVIKGDTADVLTVDAGGDRLQMGAAVAMTGVLTPAALAADTHNYNPTGLSTANVIRLSASAAGVHLSGISGGTNGRILLLLNVGSEDIYLDNVSGSSTAENQFSIKSDYTLFHSGGSVTLIYDSTASRWKMINHVPSPFIGNIQPVGGTASEGTQNQWARGDHVHAGTPADGWISVSDTWTRTGNHTFTVSGDVTADPNYAKEIKVKYNDGAVDYGVIASTSYSAPNTTVTLIPNTDYTMAAATITGTYISKIDKPDGWPGWFNYSPTYSGSGSMTYTSVTTTIAKWRMSGQTLIATVAASGTTGGTASNSLRASAPTNEAFAAITNPASYADGGASTLGFSFISAGLLNVRKADSTNYGLGASRAMNCTVIYQIS